MQAWETPEIKGLACVPSLACSASLAVNWQIPTCQRRVNKIPYEKNQESFVLKSTTRFTTPNGSKYLQSLCKHFAHKVEVDYDAEAGQAALPPGPASFRADPEGLDIEVSAPDISGLTKARFIVEDHLLRFAFREDPQPLKWSYP